VNRPLDRRFDSALPHRKLVTSLEFNSISGVRSGDWVSEMSNGHLLRILIHKEEAFYDLRKCQEYKCIHSCTDITKLQKQNGVPTRIPKY
jgi:hypothetical protein